MKNNKLYICSICGTKPDQISHHKMHLETQKHIDKKELFELKLSKLSKDELLKKYNTDDIKTITECNENVIQDQKKLNNIVNNSNDIINIEILSKNMADKYVVSNKEALKDKIHEIHNYLRNNGAGYGMNALKVFNILYGLKKIEENNLIDKIKLKKPDCKFSHLLKLAEENKDEKLAELIYGSVLDSIGESEIRDLLFYEIPRTMKSSTFNYLIKEIDNITKIEKKCNVLLSGKIYEYFIGRDESAISELGAYFTDRHITDFIYDKLKPSLNDDKSVKTMVDMFGGSGGFTTGYIDYLLKKYQKQIDWKKEMTKIHHYDMNEDVIKSAGLEFFCLTGELPDLKNLKYKNSFKDEFENKKFDYVVTNPPYGGDKNKQSDTQIKRNKVKEYIKNELKTLDEKKDKETIKHRTIQLKAIEKMEKQEKIDNDKKRVSIETSSNRINKFANKYKLTGNDKESVSLMLMMDMVEENGVCAGVLKEGVFFNGVYKDLRKCLIENYNVTDVISVPQDQFENTSTKTSIVIFKNTKEKTSKIRFSTLNVEKYENDVFGESVDSEGNIIIVLEENKGDIKKVNENVISDVKLEYVKEKKYSLNGKDYEGIGQEFFCPDGFELKKIGDLIEYKQKSKRKASDGKGKGTNRFYTSSDKIKYCDFVDYKDDLCLILGTGGAGSLFMDDEFSCSADNFTFMTKSKNMTKYLYYYIKCIWNEFIRKMFNGSTLGHINKENLNNYQIPVPKDMLKIESLIKKLHDTHNELTKMNEDIPEKEKTVQNQIQDICDNEDCDEYKLGDVCEVKYGTRITKDKNSVKDDYNSEKYPVYGGGDITFYTNKYNRDNNTIIISRFGNAKQCVNIVKGKIFLNDSALSIHNNNYEKYIGYYLLSINEKIYSCKTGSCQVNLNVDNFKNIKIKIPKSKSTMKNLEKEFEEIDKMITKQEETKKKYKEYMTEFNKLFEEKETKNDKKEIKQEDKNNDDKKEKSDDSSDFKKKEKVVKKVVKKEVKKKVVESSSESESDSSSSDDDFEWEDKIIDKVKKNIDNEKELKNVKRKYDIPKNIFDEKIKELKKKNK